MGTLSDETAVKAGLWTPVSAGSLSEQNVQKLGIYLQNLNQNVLGYGFGTLSDINARRLGLAPSSLGVGGGTGPAPPAGFAHYSTYTTNPAQCGASDSPNFPVWVLVTNPKLKTVGNGGLVQNPNGYDIRPYNAALTTALNFELELYDGVGGTVGMWVNVPNLSATLAIPIVLCYANPGLSVNGSSSATWDANYRGVYHLGNGTTLSLTDSSAAGYNLTALGTEAAGAGIINGGAVFSGNGIIYADGSNITAPPFTISCWAKFPSNPGASQGVAQMSDVNTVQNADALILNVGNPNWAAYTVGSASVAANSATQPSPGVWYHLVATFIASNLRRIYVNGALAGTDTSNCTTTSLNRIAIGALAVPGPANYFNGTIDEVRFSNIARSADWILQNYNNQFSPSTFYTLGLEV